MGERAVRTRHEPGGGKRRARAYLPNRLLHPSGHETRLFRFTVRQTFLLERTRPPPMVFTNHGSFEPPPFPLFLLVGVPWLSNPKPGHRFFTNHGLFRVLRPSGGETCRLAAAPPRADVHVSPGNGSFPCCCRTGPTNRRLPPTPSTVRIRNSSRFAFLEDPWTLSKR